MIRHLLHLWINVADVHSALDSLLLLSCISVAGMEESSRGPVVLIVVPATAFSASSATSLKGQASASAASASLLQREGGRWCRWRLCLHQSTSMSQELVNTKVHYQRLAEKAHAAVLLSVESKAKQASVSTARVQLPADRKREHQS